jgi:murein DD-endopeptidase MepM/ murein hydrolase activator NlpD
MRSLAQSRLSARVAAFALIAAGVAGCSADTTRFSDNPFSSPTASRSSPTDVTGSVPSGRVDAQPLPAPSRPASPSSTGVASGGGGIASYQPPASAPATRLAGASAPVRPAPIIGGGAAQSRPAQAASGGIHVVAPGETLTSIARLYGKSRPEIAKANKIDAYAIVRVGQRLAIPGIRQPQVKSAANVPAPQPAAKPPAAAPQAAKPEAAKPQGAAPQKVVATQGTATARLATPVSDAPEATASATSEMTGAVPSFRWPARGRVIAGFGAKVNGAANDGLNLAVPEGTSVKAAEDGVVAYAGNELKGYGNLVLVRHSNGFVTAYAHASEVMVKRGDQVKRGQTIARAGQTGSVSSPQLHFEIRKGSTPVDPAQYLNGN